MLSDGSYLSLNEKPVTFEPVSTDNNVFFDEVNKQIFNVRAGGATGVVVKGLDESDNTNFKIAVKESPVSIKYSYQRKYLGIQPTKTTLEILPLVDGQPSESCKLILPRKSPGTKIISFHWVNDSEIVLVTKAGVEFYQISQSRKEVRLVKQFSLAIIWSLFLAEGSLLVCYTSTKGGMLYPFLFKGGRMSKMPSFHVESTVHLEQTPVLPSLHEKDVTLLSIYNESYVAVVRHSTESPYTLIDLYLLSRDLPVQKIFILVTKVRGRLAISVVDNLVAVHHQASKSSMVFDIRLPESSIHGGAMRIEPVCASMPIKSQKVNGGGNSSSRTDSDMECQMYAPTWIVFPPNVIIDAALGFMWFLQLKLDVIASIFDDFELMIKFLLIRSGSKSIILKSLKKGLASRHASIPYNVIGKVFDRLNSIYKHFLDAEHAIVKARQKHDAAVHTEKTLRLPSHGTAVVIDQSDIYVHVLSVIANEEGVDRDHVVSIVIEYIRSLDDFQMQPQEYLYELMIRALMQNKRFFALEQYVLNGIIPLSKSLCSRLIDTIVNDSESCSLVTELCKKVPGCSDELIDALLNDQKVLQALCVVKALSIQNSISARKFLQAARETGDDVLFFETFKYFEHRNYTLRGSKSFIPGEQCELFVQYFDVNFPK